MSYTAACWRPRISSFCVLQFRLDDSSEVWGWECAGWVNLARWGVRSYWGNAARGGWAWVQSRECWIQVPRKCSLEMTFPPSHLFPFTGSLWLKTKWRTNQEDTKEQGLENAASFGWNENTKPEREEECWILVVSRQSWRKREPIQGELQRALELAAGSPEAAQLLGESWLLSLPTAGKDTQGHLQLQEELAWLLTGK